MSLSPILFFLAGIKSYFAAGVTLRSHEAELFSVFFFSVNIGLDLWCDAVCSIFIDPMLVIFNFRDPSLVTFYLYI